MLSYNKRGEMRGFEMVLFCGKHRGPLDFDALHQCPKTFSLGS